MKSLNIVGCGRVGRTLGRLWHSQGTFRVQDVLTGSKHTAIDAVEFIGQGHAVSTLAAMRAADLWMLAVPDRQIAQVADDLAQTTLARQHSALAFHCSGALTTSELSPMQALGWQVASAHCLLSFASPQAALRQFAGTPCALEGTASGVLQAPFTDIGAQCFSLTAEHKLLYHAGAVFATNFVPVLQALANQLWHDSGVPEPMAAQLKATLLKNAVENILALGPAGALTGPAARGDTALVDRQGAAVTRWNATAGDAYKALSKLAATLAGNSFQNDTPTARQDIERSDLRTK